MIASHIVLIGCLLRHTMHLERHELRHAAFFKVGDTAVIKTVLVQETTVMQ